MTHRQSCIAYCKEFLQPRGIPFNDEAFNHFYRKHNGAQGNPVSVALKAADHIIATPPRAKAPEREPATQFLD
ncbi:MAG: hypothetical protein EOP50_00140 [Sphingobacteriales bacterium]|nr:MAG: hypothetical protein EOP50_00140 [Sphingobacteriales bacterium]